MDMKEDLLQFYTSLLIKKSKGTGVTTLPNNSAMKSMPNWQLANELHKPIIKIFK